ncbi:MAG TPA: EamA family transporter [Casimicrobiaceae bacterium]|nr:EamA family transporter [Casimicrobiaceae bacterium]
MQRGVVYAVVAAALFGASTPLIKGLVGNVDPVLLAGLLYAGSGLGLAMIIIGRRLLSPRRPALTLPQKEEWRWLAGAIFFGGVVGPVALMYGLLTSTASAASLLLNLEAVFTALLAWFFFHENYGKRLMLGMLAIAAGGVLLVWTPDQTTHAFFGSLLVAAACLCWALDNNLTRKVSANDAVFIACLKGLAAGGVNLALASVLGHTVPSPGVAGIAAAVGFFGYGVSLVLFVLALRHLGSARTGAYFSVAPFFGAVLAMLLQGDALTGQLLAAGLLMAAGVWLHLTERHEHQHSHPPQEHSHAHIHDEHHQHSHAPGWDGREPHTHRHVHPPLIHSHPHYPDADHRHRHD